MSSEQQGPRLGGPHIEMTLRCHCCHQSKGHVEAHCIPYSFLQKSVASFQSSDVRFQEFHCFVPALDHFASIFPEIFDQLGLKGSTESFTDSFRQDCRNIRCFLHYACSAAWSGSGMNEKKLRCRATFGKIGRELRRKGLQV